MKFTFQQIEQFRTSAQFLSADVLPAAATWHYALEECGGDPAAHADFLRKLTTAVERVREIADTLGEMSVDVSAR